MAPTTKTHNTDDTADEETPKSPEHEDGSPMKISYFENRVLQLNKYIPPSDYINDRNSKSKA